MSIKDKIKFTPLKKHRDDRGWFLKVIHGNEYLLPDFTGEVYFTSAKPGQIKGGHFHEIANEWFCLINGSALMKLKDISNNEEFEIYLSEEEPLLIYVPPLIAHAFVNIDDNDDFILFAYTDKYYDPKDTIAFNIC